MSRCMDLPNNVAWRGQAKGNPDELRLKYGKMKSPQIGNIVIILFRIWNKHFFLATGGAPWFVNIFANFRTNSKTSLVGKSGAWGDDDPWNKTWSQTFRDTVPLKYKIFPWYTVIAGISSPNNFIFGMTMDHAGAWAKVRPIGCENPGKVPRCLACLQVSQA